MRLNKLVILLSILILSSCSAVFYGGFTGSIHETSTIGKSPESPIASATVFIYIDKGVRDAEFESAKRGVIPEKAIYSVVTDNTGSFSVSKIIWKTNNSEFGKSADKTKLYLLIYKEGFGENGYFINTKPITIFSDSTNEATYSEAFVRSKRRTIVEYRLLDIITNEDISYMLNIDRSKLTAQDAELEATTSLNTFNLSYSITSTPTLRLDKSGASLRSEDVNGASYVLCNQDGSEFDDTSYNILNQDNQALTLYAKRTRFTFPSFTGRYNVSNNIQGDLGDYTDDNIILGLYLNNEKIQTTTTRATPLGDGSKLEHGRFTFDAITNEYWNVTPDYTNGVYTNKRASFKDNMDNLLLKIRLEDNTQIKIIDDFLSDQQVVNIGTI